MNYVYGGNVRHNLLAMIPEDGNVIGSIGCGNGITEAELVKAGREVHGIDVSVQAIDQAKERLTSARVAQADQTLFFEEHTLDGLILADVIEHVPFAWDALKTYTKAVRPSGWVVITAPNMRSPRVLWDFVVRGDWPEHEMGIFDCTHIQVMTHKRLRRWVDQAGLEPEAWFDAWTMAGIWPVRLFDKLSFGLFHEILQFGICVRCRKRP